MKTLSVEQKGETFELDGTVADKLESLRQRIVGALGFSKGSWFFDRSAGMNWALVFKHHSHKEIVSSIITHEIEKEAGNELVRIKSIDSSLEENSRRFEYKIDIETIYGDLIVRGDHDGN